MDIPENILELSREMNKQDNRSTANPLYIVVGDEKRYGDSSWCDHRQRIEDFDEGYACDTCNALCDEGDDIPEECNDCDSEAFNWYQVEKHVPYMHHGVFLTAKACDEYIKRRSYDMPKHACSYGISSYWSYDMQEALKFLSALTTEDGKPANNYK